MKTGFIIPARLKSERLPKKILLDLEGKTVLERIIERAQKIPLIDEVVVATSYLRDDQEITKIATNAGVRYFIGEPEDILKRTKDCAQYFGYDFVMEIRPDCPLFSFYQGYLMISKLREMDFSYDIVRMNRSPIGADPLLYNVKLLEILDDFKDIVDTEMWHAWIDIFESKKIFSVLNLISPKPLRGNFRITLDTFEDYKFIYTIYKKIHSRKDKMITFFDVVDLISKEPQLLDIISEVEQRGLTEEKIYSINEKIEKNKGILFELKEKYYGK